MHSHFQEVSLFIFVIQNVLFSMLVVNVVVAAVEVVLNSCGGGSST